MSDKVLMPAVVALGYFDSVHIGHRRVIGRAMELATEMSACPAVFTFKGNLRAVLSGDDEANIYNAEERKEILNEMGIEEIYFAPVDFNYLSLGKLAFLNKLNKKYDIKAYVCGDDYKFGKFGEGNVADLIRFADKNGQKVEIVETLYDADKKISTTLIKKLLTAGDLETANKYLGENYFIDALVKKGRSEGRKIGFPTINLDIARDKQQLKHGVYGGICTVGGITYKAVINFGSRPTFGLQDDLVEAHLIGCNEDLYDKKVHLRFDYFIRDIKKFASEEELAKQIQTDLETIKARKDD